MTGKKKSHRRKRASVFVPKQKIIADSPGSITPPAEAAPASIDVMVFTPGGDLVEQHIAELESLGGLVSENAVTWVNIEGMGDAEIFKALGKRFGLHHLALEDVVNQNQRPKAEDYGDHVFVVLHYPSLAEKLALQQVSVFIGPQFVLTVHKQHSDFLLPVHERLRSGRGRMRQSGADYLGYAILDAIIDYYFPLLEQYNLRLEELEEQIILNPDPDSLNEIHVIRHDLHALRRALAPSREAIALLVHGEIGPITETTRIFLRDCQDHAAQLLDTVEACRELSASLMDLHFSGINTRMNEVMKMLTSVATIFIPLSFIAGLYGMNFHQDVSPWNMPELNWYLGYPFALLLMLVTALAFLLMFRRRGWFGNAAPKNAHPQRQSDPYR